ncbi:MAG: hypothetical protein ACT4OE_03905 [Sphingosinicella sp.]
MDDTGFVAIALMQAWVVDTLGLPPVMKTLAFPWQLCIGTAIAFLTCVMGNSPLPSGERAAARSDAG